MTEFKVEYRGVEVPAKVLTGLFGGATLEAFKLGVDSAFALPRPGVQTEPESSVYDYFTDGDTGNNNEWIWRFRKGEDWGELIREYEPEWRESASSREDVESNNVKITTLPAWAREAEH